MKYLSHIAFFIFALISLCAAGSALAFNPKASHFGDNDWISVTGDVKTTNMDRFTLAFDEGKITVEMDDWDDYNETRQLNKGEKVTVYGNIDDSFYEKRSIEADVVYVHGRNTFYYANDADEEGDYMYSHYFSVPTVMIPDGTWMNVIGKVKQINGRELVVDTGVYEVTVDTIAMGYNPVDNKGLQHIEVGDKISVTGDLDADIFEKNEIMADSIVTLNEAGAADELVKN